jgi:hypothetical protein
MCRGLRGTAGMMGFQTLVFLIMAHDCGGRGWD